MDRDQHILSMDMRHLENIIGDWVTRNYDHVEEPKRPPRRGEIVEEEEKKEGEEEEEVEKEVDRKEFLVHGNFITDEPRTEDNTMDKLIRLLLEHRIESNRASCTFDEYMDFMESIDGEYNQYF